MNATKRKFNSLIQGIGARPSTPSSVADDSTTPLTTHNNTPTMPAFPSSSPSSAADLLDKRRRLGVLESTSPNNQKTSPGGTTISNVVLKKWIPGSITSTTKIQTDTTRPRYCPSDRDELIRRLQTFQELTEWTPKPDRVNEIEWAKRGWVCAGKERVRCTLCHKELVVRTNTRTVEGKEVPVVVGSDVETALAKRFAELIIDAHDEDCLWRKHDCDDSLLRLALAVPPAALASLRQRYDDLCTRPTFLPYLFNLRLPPTFDLKAIKSHLPPNFFTDPPPPSTNPSQPNDVALALALTGWQGLTNPRIGAVPNSASCATCLRRLGLWMFRSKEVDEATGQIITPAPMDHLDPIREHRIFCPWRSPLAQQNPGAKSKDTPKAAWEVLLQTLKNSAYLRQQVEKSNQRTTPFHRPTGSLPATPGSPSRGRGEDLRLDAMESPGAEEGEEEDMAARDAKDKERWARLRRVKSLFDTKGRKKLQRTLSRPGTATSQPPTAHSRQESVGTEKPAEK
ncbi:zf-C3HC-domain-containing protein [Xylariaceae sp. FL0255]|nr:zf-C3HC-domain-containing protein [Xylariaceae sp. FL0255]